MKLSRRTLLQTVPAAALLGGASPFARVLSRSALAAGPAPKRLLIVYLPNSSIVRRWTPVGGRNVNAGTGDATQFSFNDANETLAPVKSNLTMIDGVECRYQGDDSHTSPMVKFMTGRPCNAANLATGPSIDQILLARSPLLRGAQTGSVQFAADTRSDRNDLHHRILCYDQSAQPLGPENQPHLAYMRLVGRASAPRAVPGAAPNTMELELQRAREKSIIDFVKTDLARLSRRVGAEHRMRLDSHLEGVRDLERALDRHTTEAPAVTTTIPSGLEVLQPNVSANHGKIVQGFLKTLKVAFQLDLTRVATFGFATANSYVQLGAFQSGFSTDGVHAITHVDMKQGGRADDLVKTTRWYCGVVAAFIAELQATREADGSSLLDNTLVVLFSEVAQHHYSSNIPLVLFGGSRLGLRGGRVLRYSRRFVNDLWPPIAAAFGVEMAAFGNAEENKGALPELWG